MKGAIPSSAISTLGAATPTSGNTGLDPVKSALGVSDLILAWAKRGLAAAAQGDYNPNTKSGGSDRFNSWLREGDLLYGQLSTIYAASSRDARIGRLLESANAVQTKARETTVQYATDVSFFNRAVLRFDEGVQALKKEIGEALNWTADKLVKPFAIGAGVVGGLYVVVRWGIPTLFAKKPKR